MLTADILVLGAGPAGIASAVRAAQSGRSVTVVDDNPTAGGQIWRGGHGSRWIARFSKSPITVISGAQVLSTDAASRTLLLEQADQSRRVRFQTLIAATGARELFVPFPGWTLPGVVGVGGLQALVKSGLPVGGKRIVVAGSGPLLLAVAAHLKKKGAHVLLISEQASAASVRRFALSLWRHPAKVRDAIALRLGLGWVPYQTGSAVIRAEGQGRLEAVTLIRGGQTRTLPCDFAAVAYGLIPNIELPAALGCTISQRAVAVNEYQQTSVSAIFAAGECTGIGGVDLALVEGQIAGYAATGNRAAAEKLFPRRAAAQRFVRALDRAFALRPEIKRLPKPDTIVCRCEDVTLDRLQSTPSFRAAKLHTRCGMGPCQGRVCGPAAHLLFGWDTDSVRPPTFPATIESLLTGGEEGTE